MPYSVGANKSEQYQIRDLAEAGHSAEQISHMLKIMPQIVENFMPKTKASTKKAAAKKAAPQAESND